MHALLRHTAPLLLLAAALPAHALYKVVGPDGRITYTDRPPIEAQRSITPVGARAPVETPGVALPADLRQASSRFPATLYTSSGACVPCDSARQMLRARGIPYSERQLISAEDAQAFERISGGKEVPVLTLGAQTLRGFANEVWGSYLDAAGYPRESRLPATYPDPAAQPVVERRAAPPATPAEAEQPAATTRPSAAAADPVPAIPSITF